MRNRQSQHGSNVDWDLGLGSEVRVLPWLTDNDLISADKESFFSVFISTTGIKL